jgi:hypothetical protein
VYAFVMDFNLAPKGADAERYLAAMIREWPSLHERIDGVQGIMWLGNAFALSGPYSFRVIFELDSLKALMALDQAYKSDRQLQSALADWFENRSNAESHLLRRHDGERDLVRQMSDASESSLLFVQMAPSTAKLRVISSPPEGVRFSTSFAPLVHTRAHPGLEAWSHVESMEAVETVSEVAAADGSVSSGLFGFLREVDGSLVASA